MAKIQHVLTKGDVDRLFDARIFFHDRTKDGCGLAVGRAVTFDDRSQIEPYVGLFGNAVLPYKMGAFSYSRSPLPLGLQIGRYCSIAGDVAILGTDHPADRISTSPFTYDSIIAHSNLLRAVDDFNPAYVYPEKRARPARECPIIGHDVWIGQGARIRPSVTIGTGAIIAAGALVMKDVAPYQIVGGVAAKTLKPRFDEATIERLLASEWWRYPFPQFVGQPTQRPLEFLDWLEGAVAKGDILPMEATAVPIARYLGYGTEA